jgi:LuxR family transcriptional regulator, maltose regulon positive regulatory protein
MSTPLLSTKLSLPPLRADLVPRLRLMQRLDEALRLERALALVSAPAGFGKTTLVAAWLRHLQDQAEARPDIAWLSLDEGDSDPARFLTYLRASVRSADPSIGKAAEEAPQSANLLPPEPLLTALINDVGARPRPLVLVLDDYHLITAVAVHQQVAFLLEHRPPQLHLVINSREDPPLPLARLRARGQIVELRQADLEFTPAEAGEFLRCAVRRELSAAEVVALHLRTEGWIAGLQLVALSMPAHEDVRQWLNGLTGSQRYILDYLIEEVWHRQAGPTQEFLLRTAVLDRLTASLCDALVDRDDSQVSLAALEHANLFIVPLDDARVWYRYHHLFADVLRHRLHAEKPGLIPDLHRRASHWFAAHGFLPDAIRHALAASDWEAAAELILGGTSSELLQRGELMTLLGWFRAFPEPIVRRSARLCCEYAWPLMLIGHTAAAESYLNQAELAGEKRLVERVRSASGALPLRLDGGTMVPAALSEAPLGLLPPERLPERALILLNFGMARWYKGRLAEAQEMLLAAQNAALSSGDAYAALTAAIYLNKIQIASGHLHQAAIRYEEILRQSEPLAMASLACYDLARLHFEWNELEAAATWAAEGIRLSSQPDGCDELQAVGFTTLAVIRQAQGQTAAAREGLRLAAAKQQGASCSPAGHLYCLTERMLIALAQGDLGAASRAAADVPESEDARPLPDALALRRALARLLLAQGKRAEAAGLLAALYATAKDLRWQICLTQTRAIQSLAVSAPDQALELLAEALALAEPEGYVRTFLDLGEPMAALLEQALACGISPVYVRHLLRAFRTASGPDQDGMALPRPGLLEALSQREIEVLRLLANNLTNQEIAHRLCVSENTVKTHLANIYGKLGANGRRAAVTKARNAGLFA